jgi:tetratricopeptide (TPR) repeat protein
MGGFSMRKLFTSLFLIFLTAGSLYADNPKDFAAWWIKNYGVVDAKMDPLALRAEKVFERVAAASDKRGNRSPRLIVIKASGDPYAQAIKDGTVILTQGGLKICYHGVTPEKGDARLAFILGHELAHLAKDDFWHSLAFVALKEFGDEKKVRAILENELKWDMADPKTQEFIRKQELQADSYGLIYMTMAGYDPKAIIDKDETNFFEEWVSQITGKVAYSDATHPGPGERAEFLRTQLGPVVDILNYFTFGVRLYQLGRYSDAILLFEAFKEKFPSREVFSNIGLCHYQLAMKVLSNCDESLPLRFKLPTILDIDTLGGRLRTWGSEASACLRHETFLKHIQISIYYLKTAAEMDPIYLPPRINLSSALIMSGEFAKAISVIDEAIKIQAGNPEAQGNKAVALYLFGKVNNIDTTDNALGLLREVSEKNPAFSDALYNMASIQSERGRNAAAIETWKRFLKIEPTGVYAQVAKEKLGIKSDDKTPMKRASEMKSPIKLGDIKGETEKVLKGLKKKEFNIGEFKGEIYEAKNIKFLTIDNTVEIVEEETNKPINLSEFYKTYGEPVRKIKNLYGMTLIYNNFGVDVVDGGIKKTVYFKMEGI